MIRDNSYLKGNQFAKGNKPNSTSFKKGQIPWNKNTLSKFALVASDFFSRWAYISKEVQVNKINDHNITQII